MKKCMRNRYKGGKRDEQLPDFYKDRNFGQVICIYLSMAPNIDWNVIKLIAHGCKNNVKGMDNIMKQLVIFN